MNPRNEEVRKQAINGILNADAFLAITVKNGKLDAASISTSPEMLSTMLLNLMRVNPQYAAGVTMAALAYSQEAIINGKHQNLQQ